MSQWQVSKQPQVGHRSGHKSAGLQWAEICQQVVDIGLMATIVFAPLVFGGRHDLGRLVFVVLACLTAVAWFVKQAIAPTAKPPRTWAFGLGIAMIAVVSIQLLPLPSEWIATLNPHVSSLLPLWSAESASSIGLGSWNTLSLNPSATALSLATLVAYFLLFITITQRLQTVADIQRLLQLVACSALLMTTFSLLQFLTTNGKYFWFYEVPYTDTDQVTKGSFTCRNHLAHFLALGGAPLFAWTLALQSDCWQSNGSRRGSSDRQRLLMLALLYSGLVLVSLTILLTLSRGGALALGVVGLISVLLFAKRRLLSGGMLTGLAVLGIVIVALLSLTDFDRVTLRLQRLASGSAEELDQVHGRGVVWDANIASIKQGGWLGAGSGTHRDIHHAFLTESTQVEYTHAENGYLQIGTENGWIGLGLLGLSLVGVFSWCWRACRSAQNDLEFLLAGSVTAGLLASVIHSFVDFVWFVPACMTLTLVLAACALRLSQLRTSQENSAEQRHHSLIPRLALAATCAGLAAWAIQATLGPGLAATSWDRYKLSSIASSNHVQKQLVDNPLSSLEWDDSNSTVEAEIYHLRNVLAKAPSSPRAHLHLANEYIQLFEQRQVAAGNAMAVEQVRDAAIASQFRSSSDLQKWLTQAFGENSLLLYRAYHHTRTGLSLCPLLGDGYLQMAKLCFLKGQGPETIVAYLNQGLTTNPYDRNLLFEAGRQYLLLGQYAQSMALWQRVYATPGNHQLQITRLLAGNIPASAFVELFQPNWQSLRFLWKCYQQAGNESDLLALLQHAEQITPSESKQLPPSLAASAWHALGKMEAQLGRQQQALGCVSRACQTDPGFLPARRTMGQFLLEAQQYQAAETHLRWCLGRDPDNRDLQQELKAAVKGQPPTTALQPTRTRQQ